MNLPETMYLQKWIIFKTHSKIHLARVVSMVDFTLDSTLRISDWMSRMQILLQVQLDLMPMHSLLQETSMMDSHFLMQIHFTLLELIHSLEDNLLTLKLVLATIYNIIYNY